MSIILRRETQIFVNLISYFEVSTFSGCCPGVVSLSQSQPLFYHVFLHSAALCPSFDSVAFCYPLLKHLTLHLFTCDNRYQTTDYILLPRIWRINLCLLWASWTESLFGRHCKTPLEFCKIQTAQVVSTAYEEQLKKNNVGMHTPRHCRTFFTTCTQQGELFPGEDYCGIERVLAGCEWRQRNGMRSAQWSFILLSVCDVETAALPTSQLELVAVDNAVVCGKSSAQSGDAMLRLVSWYCLHPVPGSRSEDTSLHCGWESRFAERAGEASSQGDGGHVDTETKPDQRSKARINGKGRSAGKWCNSLQHCRGRHIEILSRFSDRLSMWLATACHDWFPPELTAEGLEAHLNSRQPLMRCRKVPILSSFFSSFNHMHLYAEWSSELGGGWEVRARQGWSPCCAPRRLSTLRVLFPWEMPCRFLYIV